MVKVEAEEVALEGGENSSKKIKLDPSNEVDEKIVRQLEYYFSDVNLIKDKFLLNEIKKSDEGWVSISVLLTFIRLKELTTDPGRLIMALDSAKSDSLQIDESHKNIRRRRPLPDFDELQKELDLRTVHISGFPTDYTFDILRNYCSQFGDVESLAMRRHFKTKFFKGCIHVVFKSENDAKRVLDIEVLKCKDRELRKESMEQYHKRKAEMLEKRKNRSKDRNKNKDD